MNITEAGGKGAILIVDVQNDFCPSGALPVSGGDEVISVINYIIEQTHRLNDIVRRGAKSGWMPQEELLIVATRDWHPAKTKHFKDFGGMWPAHCVQGTRGAEFHPGLKLDERITIISKGMGEDEDAYSPFDGRTEKGESLEDFLNNNGVAEIYVCGLALDYCVKAAALDAINKGFGVTLFSEATRAVNLHPGDGDKAMEEMRRAGVDIGRRGIWPKVK